jgi:transposase InsO family protein
MTLINDYSRYTEICFLKKKSDATSHLRRFCERVNTQTGRYPCSVRSDQGGEFVNNEWITYCFEKGIIHEITAAYSPESNGIAERVNLTLANMCRLSLADLPPSLWAEAFNWATYIKNWLPHTALDGKTPYEILYNKLPTISHLRPSALAAMCI